MQLGFMVGQTMLKKHRTWRLMKELYDYSDLLLVFFGHFNEILVKSEKYGGLQRRETQMRGFKDMVDYCSVTHLGNHGERFTWQRGGTKERLDCFLADCWWSNKFPSVEVKMLPRYHSDYNALLLSTERRSLEHSDEKAFRFEPIWLTDEGCAQ